MRPSCFHSMLLVPLSLILVACGQEQQSPGQGAVVPEVTVARPLVRTIADWDNYIGQFEAVERVELRPRVTGYLVEVNFEDGQMVDVGDPLFRIDPRPFEAELNEAQSRVRSAETRRENASTELDRARGLVEIQAVSQEEFDALNAALLTATSDLEAARAAMRAAQLDVEFTRITAPVSGRISWRRVDVGNAVRADETLLTTIVSVDPIHFAFQGSEAMYLKYKRENPGGNQGAPVRIRLQDEEEHQWQGQLDFIDNVIDTASGTVRGRAVLDNPEGFLMPGMFGHMQLQASGEYEGILLPDTAIGTRGAQRIVYLVDEAGVVSTRQIELGPLNEGLRVIRSGLDGNERVVINGLQRAIPGMTVQPVTSEIADPSAGQ